MKNSTKLALGLMATFLFTAAPSVSQARSHYGFSVNLGGPAFLAPAPVYVAPAPVVIAPPPPPPVIYRPAPVVYGPVCPPRPGFSFSYVGH